MLKLIIFFISFAYCFSEPVINFISLNGTITDEISKVGLKSTIKIFSLEEKPLTQTFYSNDKAKGRYYSTGLKPKTKVIVRVECAGYFSEDFFVELPDSVEYQEVSRDFTLKPMIKGTKIPLRIHPFDRNKSILRFGIDYIFSTFIYIMKKNTSAIFEIECYPDEIKNELINYKLTQERCIALRNYFEDKGIDFNRFHIRINTKYDSLKLPPTGKAAKGKRYKGSIYLKILAI